MDEARKRELIQKDLDGELLPAEKAELARLLLQDAEARRLREDQRRADELLRDLPQAEPPPGLRSAIFEALGLEDARAANRAGGSAFGRFGMPLAAAIVGGLVVVGLGYGLLREGGAMRDLQGSVTRDLAPPPAPVETVVLDAQGGQVTARLFQARSGQRLELASTSLQPVEVRGSYDAAALRPAGAAGTAAGTADGHFDVVLTPGGPRHSVEFSGSGPIRLEVHGAGQRLGSATIGDEPAG